MFSFLLSLTIASEIPSNGSIRGKVVDKKTNEPLPGVNVIVEHTKIWTPPY